MKIASMNSRESILRLNMAVQCVMKLNRIQIYPMPLYGRNKVILIFYNYKNIKGYNQCIPYLRILHIIPFDYYAGLYMK